MELKPVLGKRAAVLGKHLIVSDPHVGFELELWRQGIKVPFQTDRMAGEILDMAEELKASSLILNGDIKHEIALYRGRQVAELEGFVGRLREHLEVIFIKGNHDGGLEGEPCIGVGKYLIFHGHSFPGEEHLGKTWVTGHVHPHVSFIDDFGKRSSLPVWVFGRSRESITGRYGLQEETPIVIMPAMNNLRTGHDINRERRKKGMVSLLDRYSAFLLEGVEVLRVDPVDEPREGDGIPDVVKLEQGNKESLNAQPETTVRD